MEAVKQHLAKVREERAEREKARIEKLRELNLKKYKKDDATKQTLFANKPTTQPKVPGNQTRKPAVPTNKQSVGPNVGTKGIGSSFLRPNLKPNVTQPDKSGDGKKIPDIIMEARKKNAFKEVKTQSKILLQTSKLDSKPTLSLTKEMTIKNVATTSTATKIEPRSRKSLAVANKPMPRKSMVPIFTKADREPSRKVLAPIETKMEVCRAILPSHSTKIPTTDRKSLAKPPTESVFDRLYKPRKSVAQKPMSASEKLKTDPKYGEKLLKKSGLITKRQTVFEPNTVRAQLPARRSISAVHFKRIAKDELSNCMHKWGSIGDNVNKVHLRDVNEDHSIREDKIVSAVKSERKKVTFQKPTYMNFNTPRPEELQARLQAWLRTRGKSLTSYHHLQCFGLHHVRDTNTLQHDDDDDDDDDKENVAVASDSDDESFGDTMNNKGDTWRTPATPGCASIPSSLDGTPGRGDTPEQDYARQDELLIGALQDLTTLIREGYSWCDAARWLRAVRVRLPAAADAAAYWECRAALEEARGDLPAALTCWEEAVDKGTESSVVEANLEPLLDKFMQLNISAAGSGAAGVEGAGAAREARRVDVRNVFKSTIIRFAVQQAKLRHSQPAPCTVTPVRRSARLSRAPRAPRTPPRTPCTPLHTLHASLRDVDATFVNNTALPAEP